MRSLLFAAAVALVPLAVVACNEKAVMRPTDAGALPGNLTQDQALKPLARFGDHLITLGDFAQAIADMPELERVRYQSLERRKELLRNMIDVQLMADEAKRLGLDKEPQVEEEQRQVLVSWMRGRLIADLPPPSAIPEADVRAWYDSHVDQYREPERRRIAHLVTKDEVTAKKAWEEAKKASATDWGTVVKRYSEEKLTEGTAPEMAGDLGYLSTDDAHATVSPKVTGDVRAAAFALKNVGDVSPPFKDANGWHVVRLLVKSDAREQSFADAERAIRIRILQDRRAAREKAVLEEMRRTVKVEIDEAALAQLASAVPDAPHPPASASASVSGPAPSAYASAASASAQAASASVKKPK